MTTLVISEAVADKLLKAASNNLESGGVLLARCVNTPGGDIRLLGCDMHWIPDKFYSVREPTRLVVDSGGFVPPLRKAESLEMIPFWVHTHPGLSMSPAPSDLDRIVDSNLADSFRVRSGSKWYGALIFGSNEAGLSFTGHMTSENGRTISIDRLWVVGSHYALVNNWFAKQSSPNQIFDRSIRAFGGDVQLALAELRVSVVGCGGIGSALTEQLARLGVRHLQLVDKDTLESSNVTRVYGSTPCDVGRGKAELLAEHVSRIAPDAKVEAIQSSITDKSTAKRLMSVDIIFGCTDDNAGRLVLSRVASYLMVPVIDSGVRLSVYGVDQTEINGRVTALGPGLPCLVCRNRIDMDRAAAETRSEIEQTRLVAEGYAPDLNDPDPAVVAYTTHVASVAVNELLERLVHYGSAKTPSELLIRLHEREISYNSASPAEGHYCHAQSGCIGRGVVEPFLGITWQS